MSEDKVVNADEGKKLAEESESGGRQLTGKATLIASAIAVFMSLFQLYTGFFGELPGSRQLSVHLAFAIVLCFIYYPITRRAPRDRFPIYDLALAVVGGASANCRGRARQSSGCHS